MSPAPIGQSRTRRMEKDATTRRETLAGWAWISPWVIGFLAFMLLPIILSLYYSFTDYPVLEKPIWIGLSNYTRLLDDARFHLALKNTAIYAALSIPIWTVLALVVASLLNARIKGKGFFQACIFLPTLVPLVASAMVWMWMLNGEYGLINQVLGAFHIRGPNWLQEHGWVLPSLVIVALWGIGQSVVIYVAALQDVPRALLEAGALDGMGPMRRFWHVTLPMISPVILFNVITLMIGTLQVFAVPYVISNASRNSSGDDLLFYSMYLYDNAFTFQQMGYASAMAWVQLIITLALTVGTFVISRRLVHYRGA
jgi:multiple sugar transport system permease protein